MLRQVIVLLCATSIYCQSASPSASDVNNLSETSSDIVTSEETKKNDTSEPKPAGFVPLSRNEYASIDIQGRGFSLSENLSQQIRNPLPGYLPPKPKPLEASSAKVNGIAVPPPLKPINVDDGSSTTITTSGQSSGQSTSYSASVESGPSESEVVEADAIKPVPLKMETVTSTTAKIDTVKPQEEEKEKPAAEYVHPIQAYHTVISPPTIQYIHSPKVTYAVNPVGHVPVSPKIVSLEHFDSFPAHASSAFKYSPAPSFFKYGPTPVPVVKPIPVPVLYDGPEVDTFHHSAPHFAVDSEPIPVPVISDSHVGYHPVPDQVVHAKSFVENIYSPTGSHRHHIDHTAHVDHSGHRYESYSRAVSYSPASSVSSVQFNGLGASYGW
ncbi:unnamed protein product [Chrysodeixis includens]|uniref:Uncharacterized protein n=1 Tax=Chrysodeixis includens TaxID=689277 RepID=A0A9P0FTL4_CHRIL|nr:unnamed protein product [Chrysodeixis includens]